MVTPPGVALLDSGIRPPYRSGCDECRQHLHMAVATDLPQDQRRSATDLSDAARVNHRCQAADTKGNVMSIFTDQVQAPESPQSTPDAPSSPKRTGAILGWVAVIAGAAAAVALVVGVLTPDGSDRDNGFLPGDAENHGVYT